MSETLGIERFKDLTTHERSALVSLLKYRHFRGYDYSNLGVGQLPFIKMDHIILAIAWNKGIFGAHEIYRKFPEFHKRLQAMADSEYVLPSWGIT